MHIYLHIDKPNPFPMIEFLVFYLPAIAKGLNKFLRSSGLIPTPSSYTCTSSSIYPWGFTIIWAFTLISPFLEYFVEFESKFRRTCWNLLLSNFEKLGKNLLAFASRTILMSLYVKVEFMRSIISFIASMIEPEVMFGTKFPFSIILWSSKSLACSITI